MTPAFSHVLNASRWMAAMVVMISHARHIVLADYGQVEHKNALVKALYFVSGLGHEAVVVFFVISGLLVGGLTLQRWKEKGVQVKLYFAHRVSRIYTVLLPALLAGWALDAAGWQWFDGSGMYSNGEAIHTNSLKPATHEDLTLAVFLGNLFMLESEYVPVLGTNGPVWSLAYEWWYYCLFAALGAAWFVRRVSVVLPCLGLAGIVAYFAPAHMLLLGLIWLMGMGVLFYGRSDLPRLPAWLCLLLFGAALTVSRLHTSEGGGAPNLLELVAYDWAIGLAYSLLLVALYKREKPVVPWARLHHVLADFSYTLYLVHFPMLIFLMAVLHDMFSVKLLAQPDMAGLARLGALCGGLVAYAFVFAWFTERHTARVRKWLESR